MGIAPQLPEQRTAAATKRSALVGIAVEGLKRRASTAATGLVGLVRITLTRLERRAAAAAAATGRAHLLLEIAAAAATRRAEQMAIAPKRPEWMTTTVAVAHRAVERMAGLASLPVIATYQLEPTAATVTRRGISRPLLSSEATYKLWRHGNPNHGETSTSGFKKIKKSGLVVKGEDPMPPNSDPQELRTFEVGVEYMSDAAKINIANQDLVDIYNEIAKDRREIIRELFLTHGKETTGVKNLCIKIKQLMQKCKKLRASIETKGGRAVPIPSHFNREPKAPGA